MQIVTGKIKIINKWYLLLHRAKINIRILYLLIGKSWVSNKDFICDRALCWVLLVPKPIYFKWWIFLSSQLILVLEKLPSLWYLWVLQTISQIRWNRQVPGEITRSTWPKAIEPIWNLNYKPRENPTVYTSTHLYLPTSSKPSNQNISKFIKSNNKVL